MSDQSTIERIEAYLLNEMKKEERHSFEQELKVDTALEKLVAKHRSAHRAIGHANREDLKARLRQIDAQASGASRRIPGYQKWAAVAAMIIAAAFGAQYWASHAYSNERIAADLFATTEVTQLRGDDQVVDPKEALLKAAEEHFLAGNYSRAEEAYSELASGDDAYHYKAEWNLLLCYLITDNNVAFRPLLMQIMSADDHPFREQATQLDRTVNHPLYRMVH